MNLSDLNLLRRIMINEIIIILAKNLAYIRKKNFLRTHGEMSSQQLALVWNPNG